MLLIKVFELDCVGNDSAHGIILAFFGGFGNRRGHDETRIYAEKDAD